MNEIPTPNTRKGLEEEIEYLEQLHRKMDPESDWWVKVGHRLDWLRKKLREFTESGKD